MCGISGIWNYKSEEPVNRHSIEIMVASLIHRGPDDKGFFYDGAVGLGIRRLSIIDIVGGKQPISNETGVIWAIHNGEIYNFQELRKELESFGHIFKTKSDSEVIVHSYEQWGIDAISKFNGMFGLALWDSINKKLIIARDPFGIKPIYYFDDGLTLVFGSEIRAILTHPKVKREVDIEALDEFLTFTYVPSPKTAFTGISKLLPGHAMIHTRDGGLLYRFHKRTPKMLFGVKETDLIENLRDNIEQSVRRQMVSDVPIGVMLSGGLDSSTIASIVTKHSHKPIKTFTVGFEGRFKYNELDHARRVSKQIGSQHYDVVISSDEFSDIFSQSIWYLEEPIANASTFAFYKLCEIASQQVKVVLMGQGADESFAGYPRYLGEYYSRLYRAVPRLIQQFLISPFITALPRNEQLKRASRSLHEKKNPDRMFEIYTIFDTHLKQQLYRDGLAQKKGGNGLSVINYWLNDVPNLDGLSQMLYIDARLYLADNLLMYNDKMAMAKSLEGRVPFLDLELMDFVESVPAKFKIKGLTQKYILKKAASKWIPKNNINRKKIGFATPVDEWFRADLKKEIENRLLSPGSACSIYFKPAVIKQMIDDHKTGRQDYKRALFSLLTFELWHEQFIKPPKWVNH